MQTLDAAIIGGGPGGLTAAIYLARFRRSLALIDAGQSRARYIPRTRNYPGFPEGISGEELLERLRAQAKRYGCEPTAGIVTSLAADGDAFMLSTGDAHFRARRVIIATGLVDKEPEMNRLKDAIRCGCIRLCAICDGHEVIDRSVAVYGDAGTAVRHAHFIRTFTDRVAVLLTRAGERLDAEQVAALQEEGIEAIGSPVTRLAMTEDGKAAATLEDGSERRFDTVYPVLGCRTRSELAMAMGARTTEDGNLFVDHHQQTSVPGLYAVGDVAASLNQLSVAVGQAAIAATDLHNALRRRPS